MAEQLRQEMIDEALPHAGSDVAQCVTISIGVAGGRIDTSRTAQWLTNEADKALYRSKAAGRNRVTTVAL
jgi:diguanylate cyclase (GGDEF)-like protein